jgi:hypothetical protein
MVFVWFSFFSVPLHGKPSHFSRLKVTAGIPLLQAVALLIMMPLFTFMGIKVSVLAGHLRGQSRGRIGIGANR